MSAISPVLPPSSGDEWPSVTLAAGDVLFRSGEATDTFFVVLTGEVALHQAGTPAPLALLGPGQLVGEAAAFAAQPHATEARARGAVTLLRVPVPEFLALVGERPDVAGAVIRTLALALADTRTAATARAVAPGPVMPRFVDLTTGAAFVVPEGATVVVGRADAATSFMPDVDLSSLDTERSLSRRHAVLCRDGDAFTLTEGPRVANGTAVNGTRLTPGQPTPLTDGDEVSFGLVKTHFRLR